MIIGNEKGSYYEWDNISGLENINFNFKREGCAVGSQPFFVLVSAVCQFVAVTFAKDKSSIDLNLTQKEKIFDIQYTIQYIIYNIQPV